MRLLSLVCVYAFLFLVAPFSAAAATLYIDPATVVLNRGDAVTLAVRIDTDETVGECINAVDAVIEYSAGVSPVDISLGSSILPVWVEAPVIDKENRRITFAGGIPNGYCGRVAGDPKLTNTLLELIFRAPGLSVGGDETSNSVTVSFAPETTLYLNDGFGTKASLQTLGTTLTLNDTTGTMIEDAWREAVVADTVPPEEFSISLEQGTGATFDGQWYIVFNTTDKQTGISHYEVIEEAPEQARIFSFGALTAPWQKVRSPYVLSDQSLRSTVRVRAIDKAGNEYVATLAPTNGGQYFYENEKVLLMGGALLVLSIVTGLLGFWWRRRQRRRALASDQSEPPATITTL